MITRSSKTITLESPAPSWLTGKRDHADKGADYTWTNGGKLQSREWQRVISGTSTRVKTTWNYHAHTGELASVDHNDSTPDLVYSFDRLGRSSQVTQAGHSWVYAYDASNLRLDTETINYDTDGNGTADFTRVLDRSQDSLGRSNGWALKNGGTTQHSNTYTYDAAGRLATVTDGTDTFTYSYVANSSDLIGTVTSPNPGSPVRKVTNTWASNRDVLTVKQNQRSVSGTLVTASQYTYTVDNLPRRTDVSFSGDAFAASGSVAWAYNTSGEVQSANHSVNTSDRYFLYDTLGNRIRARDGVTTDSGGTLTSYTTNTLNQYTALSGAVSVSPTYDLDGNQITGVLPVNPGTACGYTWDANNELSVVKSGNPLTTLATYQYDPFGRRIMRDTEGAKTWFIYDGWNLIAEYNNVLSFTRAHTWGLDLSGSLQGAGGVGGLLCSRILGTGFYPLHDGNGNITQYVNASGTISAHYEYDPFGRITYSTSSTTFNFRFSSKYYDTQTGLSYYGFRYYDPLPGRWPNRDPIAERGGHNLYALKSNNFIVYVDTDGRAVINTGNGAASTLPPPPPPRPSPSLVNDEPPFPGPSMDDPPADPNADYPDDGFPTGEDSVPTAEGHGATRSGALPVLTHTCEPCFVGTMVCFRTTGTVSLTINRPKIPQYRPDGSAYTAEERARISSHEWVHVVRLIAWYNRNKDALNSGCEFKTRHECETELRKRVLDLYWDYEQFALMELSHSFAPEEFGPDLPD